MRQERLRDEVLKRVVIGRVISRITHESTDFYRPLGSSPDL